MCACAWCVIVCMCVHACVYARASASITTKCSTILYHPVQCCVMLCSSVSCYVFTVTGQLRLISPMKSSSGNMTPQWSSPKLQLFKEACIDIHCYCSLSRLALPILWTAPLTGMAWIKSTRSSKQIKAPCSAQREVPWQGD